jgi:hypothetical protein
MSRFDRVTDFQISVPDQPGEVAHLARDLKAAGINLRALWGFGIGGGQAELLCVPEDVNAFRAFLDERGHVYNERRVVSMTGDDKLGALVDTLEQIATAGINVHATDVVALGGQFVAYLWADEGQQEKLESLLRV